MSCVLCPVSCTNPPAHPHQVCDFGSGKVLVPGEPNVAYICSRYYRAPELVFGSNDYTLSVDVWSFGCVLAELLLGAPMFPGGSGVEHLVEIIKVLGAPSKEELKKLNPSYQEFQFPNIRAHVLRSIFPSSCNLQAIAIVEAVLKYSPSARQSAIQVLTYPFFLPHMTQPTYTYPVGLGAQNAGQKLHDKFFSFTAEELQAAAEVDKGGGRIHDVAGAQGSGGGRGGGRGEGESMLRNARRMYDGTGTGQ